MVSPRSTGTGSLSRMKGLRYEGLATFITIVRRSELGGSEIPGARCAVGDPIAAMRRCRMRTVELRYRPPDLPRRCPYREKQFPSGRGRQESVRPWPALR